MKCTNGLNKILKILWLHTVTLEKVELVLHVAAFYIILDSVNLLPIVPSFLAPEDSLTTPWASVNHARLDFCIT